MAGSASVTWGDAADRLALLEQEKDRRIGIALPPFHRLRMALHCVRALRQWDHRCAADRRRIETHHTGELANAQNLGRAAMALALA